MVVLVAMVARILVEMVLLARGQRLHAAEREFVVLHLMMMTMMMIVGSVITVVPLLVVTIVVTVVMVVVIISRGGSANCRRVGDYSLQLLPFFVTATVDVGVHSAFLRNLLFGCFEGRDQGRFLEDVPHFPFPLELADERLELSLRVELGFGTRPGTALACTESKISPLFTQSAFDDRPFLREGIIVDERTSHSTNMKFLKWYAARRLLCSVDSTSELSL